MKTRFWIVFALLLWSFVLAACATPAAATESEIAPVEVYTNPEVLVDTQWILDHLDDSNVRLIDVSGNADDYSAGHLPGAVYINVGDEMTNPEDSTRGQ